MAPLRRPIRRPFRTARPMQRGGPQPPIRVATVLVRAPSLEQVRAGAGRMDPTRHTSPLGLIAHTILSTHACQPEPSSSCASEADALINMRYY